MPTPVPAAHVDANNWTLEVNLLLQGIQIDQVPSLAVEGEEVMRLMHPPPVQVLEAAQQFLNLE